jgi:hypothetical protein
VGIGWGRILGVEGGGETGANGEDAKDRSGGLDLHVWYHGALHCAAFLNDGTRNGWGSLHQNNGRCKSVSKKQVKCIWVHGAEIICVRF